MLPDAEPLGIALESGASRAADTLAAGSAGVRLLDADGGGSIATVAGAAAIAATTGREVTDVTSARSEDAR